MPISKEERENMVKIATEKFAKLLDSQLDRVDKINAAGDFIDYSKLDKCLENKLLFGASLGLSF